MNKQEIITRIRILYNDKFEFVGKFYDEECYEDETYKLEWQLENHIYADDVIINVGHHGEDYDLSVILHYFLRNGYQIDTEFFKDSDYEYSSILLRRVE